MAFVNVDGIDLHYERVGRGDTIVLTHGAWSDGRTWADLLPRLTDDFEVVTWDRRGHSRSGSGSGPGSVKQDAADLAAVIEVLGSGKVVAVGSSAGGAVVLNLVAERSDLLEAACVHEPGPFALVEHDPELHDPIEQDKLHIAQVNQMIASGHSAEAAEFFIDEVAVGPGAWARFPDEFKAILVANAETVADDLRDSWDVNAVDASAVEASGVPLMISSGTASPVLETAAAHELSRRVPSARLMTIEGAGHTPYRTHPAAFADAIKYFIETVRT